MENDWKKRLGVVYSTIPDFEYSKGEDSSNDFPPPENQVIYVSLDRKKRKGKAVTLLEGFRVSEDALQNLSKEFKKKCGVGGTTGEGYILLQGDFRDRVSALLQESGFKVKRKGG